VTTINVTQAIWGTNETRVNVVVPGGRQQVGKLSIVQVMPGAPQLLAGARMLLLLEPTATGEALAIVGFNQGALNVTADGEVVLPGETNPMPVAQAMQKIRELRAAAPAAAPQAP
jgi:hypothetical protein